MPPRARQIVVTTKRVGAGASGLPSPRLGDPPTGTAGPPSALRGDRPVARGGPTPHLGDPPVARAGDRGCCPYYHEAVEFIGKRWTGAILQVLLAADRPLRFSQIAHAVPELSDRLLSERIKELETRGLVLRTVHEGRGVRVEYALTEAGEQLEPVVVEIQAWARRWLR